MQSYRTAGKDRR